MINTVQFNSILIYYVISANYIEEAGPFETEKNKSGPLRKVSALHRLTHSLTFSLPYFLTFSLPYSLTQLLTYLLTFLLSLSLSTVHFGFKILKIDLFHHITCIMFN